MAKKNSKKEDNIGLENVIKEIQTKYGEGAIMKLGESRKVDVDVIPTGSLGLDIALGVGGMPKGRVIEIFGPESSGKTTLALHILAEAQKQGGLCAFIDAEHALDPEYAKKLGVKINDLLISQPDTGEQALEILESLIRSGSISCVVVDSVAALTPRAEIEGEMGDIHVGLQARLMSQALRKITALVARSQTTVIFINQIRMKIGVMFGCLNYKSKVTLANGKQEWIGKLVNNKIKQKVLAYNWKKNKIVPAEIINWYKNGKADKFLQITVYNPSGNGKSQLSCTTNHPILTPLGWRRAEDLKIGEHVLINSIQRLSDIQMQIIRGSLLGDGNLSPTQHKKSLGIRFRLGHSLKQKRYLLWKAGLFKNIPYTIYENKKSIKFETTPLPELYETKRLMYKNGYKFLSHEFIANLTPLSLAIWYQDDANLNIRNKKKDKGRITIYMQAIHPDSRKSLQKFLEDKYNIKTKLSTISGQAKLSFDQYNSEKFLLLIQRYVHPSMQYKLLPKNRGKFHIEPQFSEITRRPISVPIISISTKPLTKSMSRFDIGVRGYHNFLADNIIVHNSPETTPGGKALKFYSSVRIDIRRVAQIKKGDNVIGGRIRAKVVKNKVAPPFRVAEFDLLYNEGISYLGEVITLGAKYGIINKSGSSLSFGEIKLGRGLDSAKEYLKKNPKTISQIVKLIMEKKTT